MKVQSTEIRHTTRSGILSYISLFTSVGTLLCCALPSFLVLLGLGATVGAVLSVAPWLVTLSHHKLLVFTVSGVLIAISFVQVYVIAPKLRSYTQTCPPDGPDACEATSRFSKVVLWIAAILYASGFFAAYLLGPILNHFG